MNFSFYDGGCAKKTLLYSALSFAVLVVVVIIVDVVILFKLKSSNIHFTWRLCVFTSPKKGTLRLGSNSARPLENPLDIAVAFFYFFFSRF